MKRMGKGRIEVMEKIKQFVRRRWSYILVALIALVMGASFGPSQSEVDAFANERHEMQEELETLNKEYELKIKTLEESNTASSEKIEELEAKVKEAEPYFLMAESEQKEIEAALKKKEDEEKAKKVAEEEAKAKAEAEEKAKAEEEERAKAEAEEKARAAEAAETLSQKQALDMAENYLNYTAFSKKGLIEQLEYEGFSNGDATYAVEKLSVDWREQAVQMAQDYLDYTPFSRVGLIEQLEYEGFSNEDATYAVGEVGL